MRAAPRLLFGLWLAISLSHCAKRSDSSAKNDAGIEDEFTFARKSEALTRSKEIAGTYYNVRDVKLAGQNGILANIDAYNTLLSDWQTHWRELQAALPQIAALPPDKGFPIIREKLPQGDLMMANLNAQQSVIARQCALAIEALEHVPRIPFPIGHYADHYRLMTEGVVGLAKDIGKLRDQNQAAHEKFRNTQAVLNSAANTTLTRSYVRQQVASLDAVTQGLDAIFATDAKLGPLVADLTREFLRLENLFVQGNLFRFARDFAAFETRCSQAEKDVLKEPDDGQGFRSMYLTRIRESCATSQKHMAQFRDWDVAKKRLALSGPLSRRKAAAGRICEGKGPYTISCASYAWAAAATTGDLAGLDEEGLKRLEALWDEVEGKAL